MGQDQATPQASHRSRRTFWTAWAPRAPGFLAGWGPLPGLLVWARPSERQSQTPTNVNVDMKSKASYITVFVKSFNTKKLVILFHEIVSSKQLLWKNIKFSYLKLWHIINTKYEITFFFQIIIERYILPFPACHFAEWGMMEPGSWTSLSF